MKKRPSALNYSFKLLGYRARSERELIDRLSMKGYTDDEIKGTLRRLKEIGLIDDRRIAVDFKDYVSKTKMMGSIGVRNFLMSRGIPKEIIEEVCNDVDEEENAYKLIQKRIKESDGMETKRKVYSLLQRKGYSFETIRKVLKRFYNEEVL